MTSTQVQYASVIRASGNDLLELLNGILELAKVESGTVTIEMSTLPLAELRHALLAEFGPVAQSKDLDFAIDIDPNTPATITTDPQRLRQILKNLLANAFKFTDRGHIHTHIHTATTGYDPDTQTLTNAPTVIAIAVTDSGIGISPEQQQRIFEAFAQGDGTTARLYGGTGLGLSISRELIALLGGEITVHSTPNQGSTFTIYLPSGPAAPLPTAKRPGAAMSTNGHAPAAEPTPERVSRARAEPSEDTTLAGSKVLVVDDDFRNIFALTALLERSHAEVISAESGADALAALEAQPDIDVVLMDIMMPVMDGYATIRAIRTLDAFKTLPIIALTGKVVPGEHKRCIDAGANDYVPKPVHTSDLLAAMRPWLPIAGPFKR